MSKRTTQPVISAPYDRNGTRETHPAFGVATVTRSNGSSVALFQSDVLHQQTITLRISRAERIRELNRDWVHGDQRAFVEVEMSLAQWGALVSSIGIGSGVPVTIRSTETEPFVPELPYQPRLQENLDEVIGAVGKIFARAKETLAIVEDAVESKKGLRAIRDALRAHRGSIHAAESNARFAVDSMVEAGEHVTSQVRADIEAQVLAASRLTSAQAAISVPEIRLGEIETPALSGEDA